MGLTRSFRATVVKQVQENPAFRVALMEEATQNMVDGDLETAFGQIRDLVNATIGFDTLSIKTGIPKTSLMRMLGSEGNPRSLNLAAIMKVLGCHIGVHLAVHAERVHEPEFA